jgi:superfamily II DNA/RNA helicase
MTHDPARDAFAQASSFPSLFDSVQVVPEPQTTAVAVAEPAAAPAQQIVPSHVEPAPQVRTEPAEPVVTAERPATVTATVVDAPADATVVDVPAVVAGVTFADLGLPNRLVATLSREGIETPFPIQTATIPDAISGRDVLGRGQTGSGKTLAFGAPVLMRVADGGKAKPGHPKALILVPTRELAMQVNDAITPLARALGVFSRTAVGGTAYDKQIRDLRRGVDVMVATPGRLADLIERGECSLANIEITVLDEADQMADMGFLPDVTALLEQTPARSQRLLFSATLDGDVDSLVKRFLHDPVTHSVDPSSAAVSTMEHHLLLIPPAQKLDIIASIGARKGRTIMFVRTQMAVDRLAEQLAAVGVRAGALHGGKTQRVRTRTLAEFREGRVDVLVATDVAARGIHVDDVSLVVHIDPPKDSKDYLHRAGRTARAGESGTVVTLVMPRQRRSTYSMVERAGVTPGRTEVRLGAPELAEVTGARTPSGVPVRMDEPEPAPRGRGGFGHGDRSAGRTNRFHTDNRRDDRPQRDAVRRDDRGPYRPREDRPAAARPREDRPFVHRDDRAKRTFNH